MDSPSSRLRAAGQAADARRNQPVDSPCHACEASCSEKWAEIQMEVDDAVKPATPEARNRNISAAYAGMNQRNPKLQWIGLAAIVSRQAGCAMDEASDVSMPVAKGYAQTAKQALAETNVLIFSDIYPVMRFYEKHGTKALKQCSHSRPGKEPDVPSQLMEAIELQDDGDAKGAADKIAEYEQVEIVQTRIYNQREYKKAFDTNETAAKWWVGRLFGARKAEVAISSGCGDTPPVPLKGSIGSSSDRVNYYKTLITEFNGKGEDWRSKTMESIMRQRKPTGAMQPALPEYQRPMP
jgi:hypothetical protein